MLSARVIGHATATIKHSTLSGWRLLVVQPFLTDGVTPDGDPQVAVDPFGAARGATVVITSDGRQTRGLLGNNTPVRWSVIGIRDR